MAYERVIAEINIAALAANLSAVRARLPLGVKLCGVVKADAYGHGAVPVARTLLAHGADMLGVAICEEGVELREAGCAAPVLVMGFTPEPQLAELARHRLTATVFSMDTGRALAAAALGRHAEAHIKIDTGMSRLGFLPDEKSVNEICALAALPNLRLTGIYTHCATSDALDNAFMYEQRARFTWMLARLAERGLRFGVRHMMNSGAVAQTLRGAPHDDGGFFFDMARCGVMLYGLPPSAETLPLLTGLGLAPVMRLRTQIGMVKRLPAGAGVSYGHMFRTERETLVATLPVGYADGYPRRLSNQADVLVRGRRAPVIGAICMDQMMADVTDIPEARPGDEAVLLGTQGGETVDAEELAVRTGTIGYEIVCGVGKRVPRVYV